MGRPMIGKVDGGWEVTRTAREGVRTGMPVNGGEAASLVESAMLLRWRAPELALLLADRAVTAAQDDKMAILRADYVAVFALNRLGRHGEAAHRVFPAIRAVHTPPGLRHELHVELAHCAAALGEPVTALGAVRAVLAAGDDVAPVLRGAALVGAAEASVALDRDDLVTSALDEADELYREDSSLDRDTALLLRAAARSVDATRHRHRGAPAQAEAKAREGRGLLAGLADPEHDNGEVSARLMLEIVLALLDRGAGDAAMQEVRPLLRRPVRAAAAGAVGRLRLALATRVHLAEGRHEPALTLLADAVEGAQRHGVDAVLAECLEGLSHVHEARGEFADALHCMRAARAAEGRHRRDVETARSILLENCGSARREEARLVGQVVALFGNAATSGAGPDPETGPLTVEIAVEVVAPSTAESESPRAEVSDTDGLEADVPEADVPDLNVTQAEVAETDVTETDVTETDVTLVEIAEVEIAEVEIAEAEIAEAEIAEAEIAEAEIAEAEIAEAEIAPPPASELIDPPVMRPVAENQEPVSQEPTEPVSAESSNQLDSWPSEARHRHGAGTLVSVSDLLPASAFSTKRSNRRHAEGSAEDRADQTSTAETHPIGNDEPEESSAGEQAEEGADVSSVMAGTYPPLVQLPADPSDAAEHHAPGGVSPEDAEDRPPALPQFTAPGPPPAPTPRPLDWGPEGEDPAGEGQTRKMGLGDLLAEALAAYQESRDVHADGRSTTTRDDDGSTTPDAETGSDVPHYRGPGTRWTAGLALAPNPIDRREADPSEALTNPLLRLPDLTAEPRWTPPEGDRRYAAGD